jgi:hypothetical protein
MKDPRAENCRRFAVEDGKVTGVNLTYLPAPAEKYELAKASLVDEETAKGQVVALVTVLDRDNLPAQVQCYLAWPWQGWQHPARFENTGLPGNAHVPYQHVITNKYDPHTQQGPLAIFIGDKEGSVLSDVIGGLGLPGGRHVGYQLVFRERAEQAHEPGNEPGGDGDPLQPIGDLAMQLQRIEAKVDRLAKHFGLEV